EPAEEAGEGDGLAEVADATDPGDRSFEAEAEAAVGDRAVAAQVEVPLEHFLREPVGLDLLFQELEVGSPFATSNDLAVSFGGKHVHGQCKPVVLGVAL